MGLYRKKPVVVQAIQFTGKNKDEILDFMRVHLPENKFEFEPVRKLTAEKLVIHTLEGDMYAKQNDWIIKGVKGEFYPCKPEIFEETYELVSI